ncbi:unnamed protein product [Paramecium octaurelia]|uniref:Uncharacterized protein n=1 Tax=Paramecium octaurelia TaxID=43137 RepID=A0A8S1YRE8_PAROT|nr:unnamed protein product [Paramecium octaurelia]
MSPDTKFLLAEVHTSFALMKENVEAKRVRLSRNCQPFKQITHL